MQTEVKTTDIFERLRNGETILPNDLEVYKMHEASYKTKELLVQMNNATDPKEIRELFSQITAMEIDESVAVFTPLYNQLRQVYQDW